MKKIGITGGGGFIGTHLVNRLYLLPDEFQVTVWNKSDWNDASLDKFVQENEVIVHLAALNRHSSPEAINETNIELNKRLVNAFQRVNATQKQLIFSSSSQESNESVYGQSKKLGRELFVKWAQDTPNKFVGMVIPNVFGPFGKPFYNSVVATFSHQLMQGEIPKIEVDGKINFIYVDDLVLKIIDSIRGGDHNPEMIIKPGFNLSVSELLKKLKFYHQYYIEGGHVPAFDNKNDRDLFNTFRSYADLKLLYPKLYKNNVDTRGNFVEIIRSNGLGQTSFSTTIPNITRGNHFHTRKIERFAVIKGKARIEMRRINTSEVLTFDLTGDQPAYVDMPIWYTHNITNTGDSELLTVFWISEYYDAEDPDTYFEEV